MASCFTGSDNDLIVTDMCSIKIHNCNIMLKWISLHSCLKPGSNSDLLTGVVRAESSFRDLRLDLVFKGSLDT